MKAEFIEKIYAGWLAKIIGIRYGAPIEGWTYEKIKNIYGELDHYPVDYHEFARDDVIVTAAVFFKGTGAMAAARL